MSDCENCGGGNAVICQECAHAGERDAAHDSRSSTCSPPNCPDCDAHLTEMREASGQLVYFCEQCGLPALVVPCAENILWSRLAKTKDDYPILLGDTVYFENPDPDHFGDDEVLGRTVNALYQGLSFQQYEGTVTVGAEDWEGGNLECYHHEANVPRENA